MIENFLIEWIESKQKRATDCILNNGILLLNVIIRRSLKYNLPIQLPLTILFQGKRRFGKGNIC